MKTSELTGAALDWAVEVANGSSVYLRHDFIRKRHQQLQSTADIEWHLSMQKNDPIIGDLGTGGTRFLPGNSTDWAQGGPIIEREGISVVVDRDRVFDPTEPVERWYATLPMICDAEYCEYGPTPLIAACRCYVASKLGDNVDVPKELT